MPVSDPLTPVTHGGDVAAACLRFPGAPAPFVDLSTGINPHAYPIPELTPDVFSRLPEQASTARLSDAAASAYAAPSRANVVPAHGAQILLPATIALMPPGRAAILAPSYSEHARVARLAGHDVTTCGAIEQLAGADLAIIGNPNNPDGRIIPRPRLLALAEELERRGGLLLVDEAFMDVGPPGASLAGDVARGNIVVLRSFGKFFGLAGLRLGFALAAPQLAARVKAWLGPWAVSGPAIAIGEVALRDVAWIESARAALAESALRLDAILAAAGLDVLGGTSLFRLVQTKAAAEWFDHLGRAGILVRRFDEHPTWLRFGLPGREEDWLRLASALR